MKEMDNYGKEENISTKQSPPGKETRLSGAYEDESGTQCDQTPSGERAREINGQALLNFRLPKKNRLRKPQEFRLVYQNGIRFNGRFMTAFIMPSETSFQRMGITASRKAVGNAVQRNRAKRLLREAFRLSKTELEQLSTKYDWVLNARRNLLSVKLKEPLEDFRQIIAKVLENETKAKKTS